MRFIEYLKEMEGEFLPKQTTAAARMADQLLSSTGGNSRIAKKMARNFLQDLLAGIDEKSKQAKMRRTGEGPGEARQHRTAPGYEQGEGFRTSGFSRRA